MLQWAAIGEKKKEWGVVSEGHPKKVTPKRLTNLLTVLLPSPMLAHNSVKEGTMPLSLQILICALLVKIFK